MPDIDGPIGQRIRLRRTLKGMSQTDLGKALGISFQQIQKYEQGSNSLSVGRMLQMCTALDVPPSFFLEEFLDPQPKGQEPVLDRSALTLVTTFQRIPTKELQNRVYQIIKTMAGPIAGEKRGRPKKEPAE
jgi:transcriptional regulator with XRE-family HTH domain